MLENEPSIQEVREEFDDTIFMLEKMRDSFLNMALDRGIDDELIKAQMTAMVRDFGDSMARHHADPLVSHATVCSLAISSLQKWRPPSEKDADRH